MNPVDSQAEGPDSGSGATDRELISALVLLHDAVADYFNAEVFGEPEAGAYVDSLAHVAETAEQAQYLGLTDIAVRLGERLGEAVAAADAPALRRHLTSFVVAAADYVTNPGTRENQEALLACVTGVPGVRVAADELNILKLMLGMTPDGAPAQPATAADPVPDSTPPVTDAAVLGAFLQEARTVFDGFSPMVAQLAAMPADEQAELRAALAGDLESLTRGAEFSGLPALAQVLGSIQQLSESIGAASLAQIAPAVIAYLEAPTDPERAAQVAALLPGADTAAVTRDLLSINVVEAAPARPERAITATSADVSLELPEDINPELLDGLLHELPVQTSAFAQAVQKIVAGRATRDDLLIAKRAAHTLKGAANTVGVRGIASLTHALEDILLALHENSALPNLGLSQTLSYGSDCLEAMSETLCGAGAPPEDALNVLQDVLNWANRIDSQGIEAARGTVAVEKPADEVAGAARQGTDREPAAMMRIPASLIDELLRLVGETMTSTAQIQNRIGLARAQARTINRQNALLQQLVAELETMVDLRGLSIPGATQTTSANTDEFDALEFEQYNELHTLSRRLIEVATDAREMGLAAEEQLAGLAELQEAQGRLQVENQKAVMSTRMVPVSSVFSRLQRGVRQACRILDKEVDLVLHGEGTVMDGNVLQELIDALLHLLRNAVDHGIEPAAERIAAGKPPSGRIELEFRRDGDYIAVRCSDDGQGLDLDAVRAQAERAGIITPETTLSTDEAARLILLPGISTRQQATQVSGRGIGMDAVNSRVLDLKGSLHLASQRGAGLTVELKLPVTLLSTHALMVRVRNKVVALSSRGIEDMHYVAAESVEQVAAGLTAFTSEPHEFVELETALNLPGDRRTKGRHGWPVLMVRLVSGALRAVVVQEVLESRSVVVKPLGPYVPKVQGLIGATILGDGSVAPVIDLPECLYSSIHTPAQTIRPEMKADAVEVGRRRVLVVDDSISARRSLEQVVRDAGYDVRAAADGLEAIAILEQRVPDLIITDMEMPRMNGFELAQHVRAAAATRHVPVIMVTSRSTAKHQRQAELAGVNIYLTKPFDEQDLLGHVEALSRMADRSASRAPVGSGSGG